jgi:hypothetical protein
LRPLRCISVVEWNPRFNGDDALAIRAPRGGHRDVGSGLIASLFRFASVARGPRFSHDPVNLAPDWNG